MSAKASHLQSPLCHSRYAKVHVLLLQWEEDDLNVRSERERLQTVFAAYGFRTETWLIPTSKSHRRLTKRLLEFVDEHEDVHGLMIVYYGGHATINRDRQSTWSCNRDLSSAKLDWTAVQTLLEDATSHVLMLLDCCAAASAAPRAGRAVTESIVACGWEDIAPPPGDFSFTNTLIEVLWDFLYTSFTTGMLHSEILRRLKHEQPKRFGNGPRVECRRTPVLICPSAPHIPGIVLCRQPPSAILDRPDLVTNDTIPAQPSDNASTTFGINTVDVIKPKHVEIIEVENSRSLVPLASEENLPRDDDTCTERAASVLPNLEETSAVFDGEETRKVENSIARFVQQIEVLHGQSAPGQVVTPNKLQELRGRLAETQGALERAKLLLCSSPNDANSYPQDDLESRLEALEQEYEELLEKSLIAANTTKGKDRLQEASSDEGYLGAKVVESTKASISENTLQLHDESGPPKGFGSRVKRKTSLQYIAEFNIMKKSLTRDLQNRCERVVQLELALDEVREQCNATPLRLSNSPTLAKEIAFLEQNIEQLSDTIRQLVKRIDSLEGEAAIAEMKIVVRDERIQSLKSHLSHLEASRQRFPAAHQIFETSKDRHGAAKVGMKGSLSTSKQRSHPVGSDRGSRNS